MERLIDDVLVGQQEMVGAIDAVCAQASRIIGRLKAGTTSADAAALLRVAALPTAGDKVSARHATTEGTRLSHVRSGRPVAHRSAVAEHSRRVRAAKKPAKRSGKAADAVLPRAATAGETPLRIPFGNKETALELGARYRAGGWYAPPGVDLSGFRDRGWL